MKCSVVELWVTGFHWVKFDTEKEPVRKPMLSCRGCPEEATHELVSPEGFRFHWCGAHAFEPICNARIVFPCPTKT